MTPVADESARTWGPVVWLGCVMALVVATIQVGALTRLTDSGLSMTTWQPILGVLPPLHLGAWQHAFELYQQTPEFALQNPTMTLEEFKRIFWWEYAHRIMGRLVGVVYAVPLVWFWWRGRLENMRPLLGILALGALQGLAGWWMVRSGLEGAAIDVAPVRLMVHLLLAFIILGLLIIQTLARLPRPLPGFAPSLAVRGALGSTAVLLLLTIASGALVAGTDSGTVYNTWPLMGGRWIPELYTALPSWWQDLTENPAAIQFNHRLLAQTCALVGLVSCGLILYANPPHWVRVCTGVFAGLWLVQVGLGVMTVISGAPLTLALYHQAGAVLLFVVTVVLAGSMRSRL